MMASEGIARRGLGAIVIALSVLAGIMALAGCGWTAPQLTDIGDCARVHEDGEVRVVRLIDVTRYSYPLPRMERESFIIDDPVGAEGDLVAVWEERTSNRWVNWRLGPIVYGWKDLRWHLRQDRPGGLTDEVYRLTFDVPPETIRWVVALDPLIVATGDSELSNQDPDWQKKDYPTMRTARFARIRLVGDEEEELLVTRAYGRHENGAAHIIEFPDDGVRLIDAVRLGPELFAAGRSEAR